MHLIEKWSLLYKQHCQKLNKLIKLFRKANKMNKIKYKNKNKIEINSRLIDK